MADSQMVVFLLILHHLRLEHRVRTTKLYRRIYPCYENVVYLSAFRRRFTVGENKLEVARRVRCVCSFDDDVRTSDDESNVIGIFARCLARCELRSLTYPYEFNFLVSQRLSGEIGNPEGKRILRLWALRKPCSKSSSSIRDQGVLVTTQLCDRLSSRKLTHFVK